MSTATRKFNEGMEMAKTVAAGQIATQGFLLIPSGVGTVQDATSPAATGLYVAKESRTAAQRVQVFSPGSGCIPVTVGTGGATRGVRAIWSVANDGFCDAPAMANGATHTETYGKFEDSGVAGTTVGLWFFPCAEREST
jgi:hypothetical protein